VNTTMSDDSKLLEEILKNATTRTYAEYVSNEFGVEKKQIELGRALEKQVLEQFASYIANQGYVLDVVPQEKLEWARSNYLMEMLRESMDVGTSQ